MPKVATGRKFRNASSVGSKATPSTPAFPTPSLTEKPPNIHSHVGNDAPPQPSSTALSRGQKKRQMKRDQYLRKEQMVLSSLRLKHQEEQSRRIDGLDALKDALLNVEATAAAMPEQPPVNLIPTQRKIKTNNSRQALLQKEVAHMNLVLQHPRFVEDPFSTIYEHLQNTFPSSTTAVTTQALPAVTQKRKRHKRHYRATRSKGS